MAKSTVRKPSLARGCESCDFRVGDFSEDTVNPKIIRSYCRARHVAVDAEEMSKNCDFFVISDNYKQPKEDKSKYGL